MRRNNQVSQEPQQYGNFLIAKPAE